MNLKDLDDKFKQDVIYNFLQIINDPNGSVDRLQAQERMVGIFFDAFEAALSKNNMYITIGTKE